MEQKSRILLNTTRSTCSSNTRTLLHVFVVLNFFFFDVSLAFVASTTRTPARLQPLRDISSTNEPSQQHQEQQHEQQQLKADDINQRLRQALEKMKERDRNSRVLKKEDLIIAYQDDHIIVIDKPSGVLSVSSEKDIPSLCKTVYETFQPSFQKNNITMGQMVVHRLGMDTSGLIVFCQTMEAVRGMHTLFRSRQVVKEYEALVCGHVAVVEDDDESKHDSGIIRMSLMRDYERPPYMRISTKDHQLAIASLDEPDSVHKKFLEAPKSCITQYRVLARDYLDDTNESLPVTRLMLTSISGRTHQLNVHCAAMDHPIVFDSVYGWNGEATPQGGLDFISSTEKVQQDMHKVAKEKKNMCIHATFLSFRHPVTKTAMSFRSPAPF